MKPIAVWDCREKPIWEWDPGLWGARAHWLFSHGLPARQIYRVEFYLIDGPTARYYAYHLNDAGDRHWETRHDPATCTHDHTCGPCVLPPADAALPALPPDDLL